MLYLCTVKQGKREDGRCKMEDVRWKREDVRWKMEEPT